MTCACIVQARLGSTRLPAKVLLPLPTGRTVLEEVLWRCRQIEGVDVVVCAIPDTSDNDLLETFIAKATEPAKVDKILAYYDEDGKFRKYIQPPLIVRGPEHDVLARYVKAAEAVKADIIMRITADCPLIDPDVCGNILLGQRKTGVGYCSNVMPRTWPQGLDCEVFTLAALKRQDNSTLTAEEREHVTLSMQRDPAVSRANYASDKEDRSHLRWTLDTLSDYVTIWNVMEQQMGEAA